MVVGFAAGAATDTIGRVIAERMKRSLGQPVIVENVTGAGGTIAAGRVARAAPDGYTLGIGNNGQYVMAGAAYALQYDLLNDFEPVALLSTGPYVLTAKKTMPANDLKGLIAWLKAPLLRFPSDELAELGGNSMANDPFAFWVGRSQISSIVATSRRAPFTLQIFCGQLG